MPKVDLICDVCNGVEEVSFTLQEIEARLAMPCGAAINGDERCPGEMRRVWGPVHLGGMSSGEPPR